MKKYYPLLFLFFAFANLPAQTLNTEKTAIKLMEKMDAEPAAWHSVHIILSDQVDLQALDQELAARRANRSERSQIVVSALRAKADEAQSELLKFLRSSDLVQSETVNSHWLANAIFAEMKMPMVAQLSQLEEVEWIGLNGQLQIEKAEKVAAAPPVSPDGIEPGLAAIDAPALWSMGYTGYGQLAFTSDTGVDPTHPALTSRNYNFYVPKEQTWFEIDPTYFLPNGNHDPFDCSDHGTHVTGTMLGLDRLNNDTIGVAFNANWMGSPTLCGIGTEDNIAAFEWAMNPDGDPATFNDIPTVINNSWWDPSLDTLDCVSLYVPILEATEIAGIAVIFSAGNGGPNPMTITQPKNIIINEVNPFTVGALNGNNANFPIANFSSRGPSHCDADSALLIKPEVSAPGFSVRSSVPGPGYDFFNGTSMAAPHVCGAILLLGEAFPELNGKDLKLAIYHSCTDLGQPGEDNVFGQGIINVLDAFNYLVDQGNVPVSPYRANDVMIVDMEVSAFSCEAGVAPTIIFENAGTDTIYSFDIFYEVETSNTTETWVGVLAPNERSSMQLLPLPAPLGLQDVFVRLEMPNGVEDERPFNNNFRRSTLVTERERFVAQVEGGETACEGTVALLRGESAYDFGAMQINWYDSPSATDPVSTAEAFLTPPLSASTTYYAEPNYMLPLGPKDSSIGDAFLLDTAELGMRFEVMTDLTLNAVYVDVEETGGRVFLLQDSQGEELEFQVEFINETGHVRVDLGWALEPGSYEVLIVGGKELYANSTGATYPQEVEGVFSITGTTDNQSSNGAWYYFYDWEIEFAEPCGRIAVSVEVGPAGDAPVADFAASVDTVNVTDATPVQFTNTSQDGAEFLWNFGDGNFSNEESPAHTFEEEGVFTVSLTTTSADGCSDAALHLIVVEGETLSPVPAVLPDEDNVTVFPNPVRNLLTVHLELTTARPVTLRLMDTSGRLVRTEEFSNIQAGQLQVPVADLPDGIYFLLVESGGFGSAWKVLKI